MSRCNGNDSRDETNKWRDDEECGDEEWEGEATPHGHECASRPLPRVGVGATMEELGSTQPAEMSGRVAASACLWSQPPFFWMGTLHTGHGTAWRFFHASLSWFCTLNEYS
mmetsp:Transcript_11961/g.28162  ORF Transcript_11961/g.28162 Transcript_11961/m.28162 type:complete len:111 (-) Transcript_11961:373-705(-)